jgi:hypothetical protein
MTLAAYLILALASAACAAVCWANLAGQHHEACRPAAPAAPAELVRHDAPESEVRR